ncbi:preprotein translocase subunit YajC [Tersicoccus sp. MR15.9]|uniref:preprotein translocase subunit YajC n=1 Tax=Tersicoccus mangrovi TaxID=3121635 RepID=UPI002FE65A1F
MDPLFLIMIVVLIFLIFTMFRRNKKAQAEAQARKSSMAPGQEVMTSYGLFGTVLSVDAAENKVVLELSPGNTATVHLQSVTKILDPAEPAADDAGATATGAPVAAEPLDTPVGTDRPRTDAPATDGFAGSDATATRAETPEETMRRLNEHNDNNNR